MKQNFKTNTSSSPKYIDPLNPGIDPYGSFKAAFNSLLHNNFIFAAIQNVFLTFTFCVTFDMNVFRWCQLIFRFASQRFQFTFQQSRSVYGNVGLNDGSTQLSIFASLFACVKALLDPTSLNSYALFNNLLKLGFITNSSNLIPIPALHLFVLSFGAFNLGVQRTFETITNYLNIEINFCWKFPVYNVDDLVSFESPLYFGYPLQASKAISKFFVNYLVSINPSAGFLNPGQTIPLNTLVMLVPTSDLYTRVNQFSQYTINCQDVGLSNCVLVSENSFSGINSLLPFIFYGEFNIDGMSFFGQLANIIGINRPYLEFLQQFLLPKVTGITTYSGSFSLTPVSAFSLFVLIPKTVFTEISKSPISSVCICTCMNWVGTVTVNDTKTEVAKIRHDKRVKFQKKSLSKTASEALKQQAGAFPVKDPVPSDAPLVLTKQLPSQENPLPSGTVLGGSSTAKNFLSSESRNYNLGINNSGLSSLASSRLKIPLPFGKPLFSSRNLGFRTLSSTYLK